MDRQELADFLRGRRARVQPADVGLEPGPSGRRRTPGLRREEVARLAGMSVDYYIRLEQARGPRPSRQVLAALSRALRLSDGERGYLFSLVGETPQPPTGPPRDVPSGVLHLLDRLDDTPAYVLDAGYNVLAWNTLAATLVLRTCTNDKEAQPNPIRWFFQNPEMAKDASEDLLEFVRDSVADLRASAARYPNDPGIASMVADLSARSPLFARWWSERDVRVQRSARKEIHHPEVGVIEVHADMLLIPERDQRLVLYTTTPGTPSHEAMQLLKVVGSQFSTDRTP